MIVCVCKAVSDRDVACAIAGGARTVDEVASCTGAGTDCGSCRDSIGCALGGAARTERSRLIALRTLAAVVG